MNRIQFGLVPVMTLIGSLTGGRFGSLWLASSLATVEKANSVNAEESLLIDSSGEARAGLGLDQNGEVGLILTNRDGNRKLSLTPDERTVIELTERSGQILWSVPSSEREDKSLDRLLDFSTPETAGTDPNASRRAFNQSPHGLKIRIEHPVGLVIRVTDVMAALVPLPA